MRSQSVSQNSQCALEKRTWKGSGMGCPDMGQYQILVQYQYQYFLEFHFQYQDQYQYQDQQFF